MDIGGDIGVPAADVGGVWSIDDLSRGGNVSAGDRASVGRKGSCPLVTEGGSASMPVLEGVLVTEWMPPEVGHDRFDRGSKGRGESIDVDAGDMVSKSGLRGSRYGFDVLINVTAGRVIRKVEGGVGR